ncbi:MAG: DUF3461 family protein [Clostridia bacterium]|nr:DUF3461 family protein [Clostridia bacterium]
MIKHIVVRVIGSDDDAHHCKAEVTGHAVRDVNVRLDHLHGTRNADLRQVRLRDLRHLEKVVQNKISEIERDLEKL